MSKELAKLKFIGYLSARDEMNLHIEDKKVFELLEIASQVEWKYPEQNEVPDDHRKVFCIDSKNMQQIGFHKNTDKANMFIDNYGNYFYCIAWSECPSFL